MKTATIAAFVAVVATTVAASPVQRDITFPTACNTACSPFLSLYDNCVGYIEDNVALNTCLQPMCAPATWPYLGACLTSWALNTNVSTLDFFRFFAQTCT